MIALQSYEVIDMVKTLKLSVKGLTISSALVFGVSFAFLGWISAAGWGAEVVNLISSVYVGYKPGFLGGIIGGLYAAVDGAIGGALIAWLYNKFS
jgi:hypothetical protein